MVTRCLGEGMTHSELVGSVLKSSLVEEAGVQVLSGSMQQQIRILCVYHGDSCLIVVVRERERGGENVSLM